MITGINESKTLNLNVDLIEKYVIQINGGIRMNVNVSVKDFMYVKKIVWNPTPCSCENGKYLGSIMNNSVIICDEVIESYGEEIKTIPTNFKEEVTCKTQNLYILLAFLLITIALLVAVSIYCYLIIYQAKQKFLLPFHVTNNKLKEVMY